MQIQTISSSTSDCLVVKQDVNKLFSDPFDVSNPRDYIFNMALKVTNNCIRPVSIIDPLTLTSLNKDGTRSLTYTAIDRFDGSTGLPVTINNLSDFGIGSYGDTGTCVNCPSGAMQYRFSPLGTYNYQNASTLRVFSLAVGETRKFEIQGEISIPNHMEFGWWLRAKLTNIKWFYNSAFNDNLITSDEIRTKNFTASEQQNFATDYVTIVQEGNPLTCGDGQQMSFNEELEPVCE